MDFICNACGVPFRRLFSLQSGVLRVAAMNAEESDLSLRQIYGQMIRVLGYFIEGKLANGIRDSPVSNDAMGFELDRSIFKKLRCC